VYQAIVLRELFLTVHNARTEIHSSAPSGNNVMIISVTLGASSPVTTSSCLLS